MQLVWFDLSDPIKIHKIYWERGYMESLKLNFLGKHRWEWWTWTTQVQNRLFVNSFIPKQLFYSVNTPSRLEQKCFQIISLEDIAATVTQNWGENFVSGANFNHD